METLVLVMVDLSVADATAETGGRWLAGEKWAQDRAHVVYFHLKNSKVS